MKLHLENIGKIKEANVDIGGLTLIAGENDTGKSTIGKVMFGLTMSMVYGEKKYNKEKITNVFSDLVAAGFLGEKWHENKIREWNEKQGIHNTEAIKKQRMEFKNEKIDKQTIIEKDMNKVLNDIFSYKVKSIFNNKKGEISFENGQNIDLEIDRDDEIDTIKITNQIKGDNFIFKDAIFIDNPLILDYRGRLTEKYKNDERYKKNILEYHICEILKDIAEVSKNKLYIKERKDLIKQIEKDIKAKIVDYDKVYFNSNGDLKFKTGGSPLELDISNMASGGKSFSMLLLLILGGYIDKYNQHLIIIDEPENHLHPEWQVKYANLIMYLVKYKNCNFIINSHSPYLIQGLVHYAKVYDVEESDLNFHIAERDKDDKNYANIRKINNLSEIFNKFAEPLRDVMSEPFKENNV